MVRIYKGNFIINLTPDYKYQKQPLQLTTNLYRTYREVIGN